ncbi:MAG: EF-hand domain-containing protein [Alphaproteobacteria bacterium]|nr:EF-hand domain-containing protein [Alphaproteobacteria bacterium]
MKKLLLGTVAVFAMASVPAFADHHGDGAGMKGKMHEKMFEKHDANGDGKVTKEEFIAKAEERFNSMDTDGNGEVTMEESKAYYKAKHEAMKDKMEKMQEMKEEKAAE